VHNDHRILLFPTVATVLEHVLVCLQATRV
jgi:hypothetical protein